MKFYPYEKGGGAEKPGKMKGMASVLVPCRNKLSVGTDMYQLHSSIQTGL